MREIKFRAWDKANKIMIIGIAGFVIAHNEIRIWHFNIMGTLVNKSFPVDNIILMQYTGLKDKNGKEIYEGDILKTEAGNIKIPNVTVYWFEQGGRWNGKYHGQSEDCEINDSVFYTSEVIGNIYENPNLITEDI